MENFFVLTYHNEASEYHKNYVDNRLKTMRAINTCLQEIGIDISISEREWMNDKIILMMLPVGKQQVYWLSSTSFPSCADLERIKYRADILMKNENGFLIEGKKIIARNAQYVVVIEPEGIAFDKYLKKLEPHQSFGK